MPEKVDSELQRIIGQHGLILLTPAHMSYKYNRAIEHFWSQQKGYARRHFEIGRNKEGAKAHLLQGAFGRWHDGVGAPDCAKLFRHEEDELQEVIDNDQLHLLPGSSINDLKFTPAAKNMAAVKLYLAAKKAPTCEGCTQPISCGFRRGAAQDLSCCVP
jgi:hypothetical protein